LRFDANAVNLADTLLDQTFVKWCLLPFVTKKTVANVEEPPPFPELACRGKVNPKPCPIKPN
jgi:hypothetical protein